MSELSFHPRCAVVYFALWTRLHLVIEHRADICLGDILVLLS